MTDINRLLGINAVMEAKYYNNNSFLIHRLRLKSNELTIDEREYLANLLEGKENRKRGRTLDNSIIEKIIKSYMCVFCLINIEKWGKDAAIQKASELFLCSRSTMEKYISEAEFALKDAEIEKQNQEGDMEYFVNSRIRNHNALQMRRLQIRSILKTNIEYASEMFIKGGHGYDASDWRFFYCPETTAGK